MCGQNPSHLGNCYHRLLLFGEPISLCCTLCSIASGAARGPYRFSVFHALVHSYCKHISYKHAESCRLFAVPVSQYAPTFSPSRLHLYPLAISGIRKRCRAGSQALSSDYSILKLGSSRQGFWNRDVYRLNSDFKQVSSATP